MSRPDRFVGRSLGACLLLVCSLAGCSDEQETPLDPEKVENLKVIQEAYMKARADLQHAPNSKEELKPYLPASANIDELFRSPNDGQEYVIIWGTDPFGEGAVDVMSGPEPKARVVGYEKEGKDGVRYVFLVTGVVQMDGARFSQANFPPGHQP